MVYKKSGMKIAKSNLFIIRCVVSFSSQFDNTDIIAGGNNITKDVDLLIAPTSNNLPDNFGIYYKKLYKWRWG